MCKEIMMAALKARCVSKKIPKKRGFRNIVAYGLERSRNWEYKKRFCGGFNMKRKISVFGYGKLVAKLKLARERKPLNEENEDWRKG